MDKHTGEQSEWQIDEWMGWNSGRWDVSWAGGQDCKADLKADIRPGAGWFADVHTAGWAVERARQLFGLKSE